VIGKADGGLIIVVHPDPQMVPTKAHLADGAHPIP
jgi:hypothetical protein